MRARRQLHAACPRCPSICNKRVRFLALSSLQITGLRGELCPEWPVGPPEWGPLPPPAPRGHRRAFRGLAARALCTPAVVGCPALLSEAEGGSALSFGLPTGWSCLLDLVQANQHKVTVRSPKALGVVFNPDFCDGAALVLVDPVSGSLSSPRGVQNLPAAAGHLQRPVGAQPLCLRGSGPPQALPPVPVTGGWPCRLPSRPAAPDCTFPLRARGQAPSRKPAGPACNGQLSRCFQCDSTPLRVSSGRPLRLPTHCEKTTGLCPVSARSVPDL